MYKCTKVFILSMYDNTAVMNIFLGIKENK